MENSNDDIIINLDEVGISDDFDDNLEGEKHFNEFENYPKPNNAIQNIWFNVGVHLDNATLEVGEKSGIRKVVYKRKSAY